MKVEKRDLSLKAILASLAIFVGTISFGATGLWFIYKRPLLQTRLNEPRALKVNAFPKPPLMNQHMTLTLLRRREERILTTYSPSGARPGTVRVPIERAMKEMAK